MTTTSVDRPINFYRVDPQDWQMYINKLFKNIPGTSLAEKHEWLSTRLGVSATTTALWLNKAQGVPSTESLSAMAELFPVPLLVLIGQVQNRLDPPPLVSDAINAKIIMAICEIPPNEIAMIAKSLEGVSQVKALGAAANLALIANALG
jgi:transcriptional regulator with XRE-family HTH domain